MSERTLAIIKPDAVGHNAIGPIIAACEGAGLVPVAMRMMHLSKSEAEGFYAEHKGKPFFDSLVSFMISGPIVVMVLEGESAIKGYRALMGATNPAQAEEGTLRRQFATSIDENAVHGSDSAASAEREISFFFEDSAIFTRTR